MFGAGSKINEPIEHRVETSHSPSTNLWKINESYSRMCVIATAKSLLQDDCFFHKQFSFSSAASESVILVKLYDISSDWQKLAKLYKEQLANSSNED